MSLRIGCLALARSADGENYRWISRPAAESLNLHAGDALRITEGTARDNRLDVAFMAFTHEIPNLHARVVWRDRLLVTMPETHPLVQREHISWQNLPPA
ncbi:LysR substrate-binding domain-containing protein [Paenirhodobacter sp.]|uniref:LysR substrate-binding domain-containing protein n=1 Tax=Paenirhodobacter sp. TaxID=1965326 RepID=UPI003B424A56